jgi:hypothetical protein
VLVAALRLDRRRWQRSVPMQVFECFRGRSFDAGVPVGHGGGVGGGEEVSSPLAVPGSVAFGKHLAPGQVCIGREELGASAARRAVSARRPRLRGRRRQLDRAAPRGGKVQQPQMETAPRVGAISRRTGRRSGRDEGESTPPGRQRTARQTDRDTDLSSHPPQAPRPSEIGGLPVAPGARDAARPAVTARQGHASP